MKLTVAERIQLQNVLPPQSGDITTLKLVRKFREALSFSNKERQELQFLNGYKCGKCGNEDFFPVPVKCGNCDVYMQFTGHMKWDADAGLRIVKDVFIDDTILLLLVYSLKRLSDEKKLGEGLVELYDKLMPEEEGEEGNGKEEAKG